MNSPSTERKFCWTFILPAIAVGVAAALFYLDQFWLRAGVVWDDLPVTTAQGLAALLLGPSPLIAAKEPFQLEGVAIFWAWLGFLLDRRFSGIREPIIRNKWLRLACYLLGLILALSVAWHGSRLLASHAEIDFFWRALRFRSPRRTLLGRQLTTLAQFLWGIGCAAYFSAKLWRTIRKSGPLLMADG